MARLTFLIAVLLSWMSSSLLAQPAGVTRVLKNFDFEERRLGNEEDLPMHWSKLRGPGLPHYVNGRLTTDRHRSGDYSFRFDLNGGSLIYRYQPGRIKAQPGAHYHVEAWCQTSVLPNARARLTACLADADGHVMPQTARHSDLYAAQREDEPWQRLAVELTADAPGADSVVIDLELLQPSEYRTSRLGDRALFEQDIRGSAWFDDVSVSQVPQVALQTERPGNIYGRGEPVELSVLVNDRLTDDLVARLTILDADGHERYQWSGAFGSAGERVAEGVLRMRFEVPALGSGFYRAHMAVSTRGQSLGDQELNLVMLQDTGKSLPPPDERFGLVATSLPFESWDALPQVLPLLPAGRVKVAVWNGTGDVGSSDDSRFDRLLLGLQEIGVVPTACLIDPPPSVSQKLGGRGWTKLADGPREAWQPQLALMVSRHATHVDRWQIGADGSDAFVTDPVMREVYRRVHQEFAALTDKPDLAMPWPAWYELPAPLPATVALTVPPAVLPEQLSLYIQDIRGSGDRNVSLFLQPLDRARYGRDVQVSDLARRVVYALASGASRIDLPMPMEPGGDAAAGLGGLQPQELFPVVRTLLNLLSGAQYRGRVPIAEGIDAFLFDQRGKGLMILWSNGKHSGPAELPLEVGEEPIRVDLWGNAAPLPRPTGDRKGRVLLEVGQVPIFLVDIDGRQAQLRATVHIDRPQVESTSEQHARRLRFTNVYDHAITGMLRVKAPPGWILSPATFDFSLAAGEVFDRELKVQFPYNTSAGPKALACEFLLMGERNPSFSVPITLQLGLSDVGMQSIAFRDGADLVVQQIITNYGEAAVNYVAFSMYPGQARQERMVNGLAPGATTIKRYRFEHAKLVDGARVRVGVKELIGMRILNDEVNVE